MSLQSASRSFDRILVPTDFSDCAERALEWAVHLARSHNASLTVQHVADVHGTSGVPMDVQDRIGAALSDIAARIQAEDVRADTAQDAGPAWECISNAGKEHDLIVIGARGQSPKALHMLGIGTVADRVIRHSPCPVLTIPPDHGVPDGGVSMVLIPTDFSDTSRIASGLAADLLRASADDPLSCLLLHAWQPVVEYEYAFAGTAVIPPPDGSEDDTRSVLEAMANDLHDPRLSIEVAVHAGYPSGVIVDAAKDRSAGMIVMGTHGRSGTPRLLLGSVAERVMHHSPCPVCTFH